MFFLSFNDGRILFFMRISVPHSMMGKPGNILVSDGEHVYTT